MKYKDFEIGNDDGNLGESGGEETLDSGNFLSDELDFEKRIQELLKIFPLTNEQEVSAWLKVPTSPNMADDGLEQTKISMLPILETHLGNQEGDFIVDCVEMISKEFPDANWEMLNEKVENLYASLKKEGFENFIKLHFLDEKKESSINEKNVSPHSIKLIFRGLISRELEMRNKNQKENEDASIISSQRDDFRESIDRAILILSDKFQEYVKTGFISFESREELSNVVKFINDSTGRSLTRLTNLFFVGLGEINGRIVMEKRFAIDKFLEILGEACDSNGTEFQEQEENKDPYHSYNKKGEISEIKVQYIENGNFFWKDIEDLMWILKSISDYMHTVTVEELCRQREIVWREIKRGPHVGGCVMSREVYATIAELYEEVHEVMYEEKEEG
ncbi:hypothetical protein A2229_01550 [Candidatus Peregrinibacteria bacterium RIFOXYA2_FULL_33_7]|nr:MAG: hypothetical protein A2229_01550 [Candidatus Peregrinibacteria bacterium RIFOXYA2_FULL_33_7]